MATLCFTLKKLFPFKGYKFVVLETEKSFTLELKPTRKRGRCPECKRSCPHIASTYVRKVRDLDVSEKECYLEIPVRRIHCKCGYRGNEEIDFVEKSHRVTKRLEQRIVLWASMMPLRDVSRILRLDWKTVKKVDFESLKSILPDPQTLSPRRICLDEIAVQKGHKYLTIIRDYDTGEAIAIVKGRTYEEVREALLRLGADKLAQIAFACMDMWDAYIKVIKELCPRAIISFDKFHVVKKLNEALDVIRKEAFASAEPAERKLMKHKRFLILKKNSNLTSEKREQLDNLLEQNSTLYQAYLLKEQLLSIFDNTTSHFEQIVHRFNQWFENILSSQLKAFIPVLNMIQAHLDGVLNYFRTGMTNGRAEGFNNKINVLKRRAYGFRDIEYFILKIFQAARKQPSTA